MAKSRAWKPKTEDRIEWSHPYIQFTRTAPGYLVQELFGYEDSTWSNWLRNNATMVIRHNRQPWIRLELLSITPQENHEDD
ncbi:MAG: hypothetical protein AAFP69_15860 [Planctomycetota bacterium]